MPGALASSDDVDTDANPELELRDLPVRVPGGGPEIARVNLTVAKGQIVFVRGDSGAGKSILLRTIAGLEPTDVSSGALTLAGKSPTGLGLPNWRARVSYVAQNRPSVDGTPRQLHSAAISLASQRARLAAGTPSAAARTPPSLDDIAARLGLDSPSCVDRAWSSLSGGEAQRAMLAVHLATAPDFLLVDEPTAACDLAATAAVEAALATCGAGVIWVTHDHDQTIRIDGHVYSFPPRVDDGGCQSEGGGDDDDGGGDDDDDDM